MVVLFIIPALAMKSFAEEQKTEHCNFFSTIKHFRNRFREVFRGIFGWDFMFLPSLVLPHSVYVLGVPAGNLDLGATLGSYFGIILLIVAFSWLGFWQVRFLQIKLWLIYWAFS